MLLPLRDIPSKFFSSASGERSDILLLPRPNQKSSSFSSASGERSEMLLFPRNNVLRFCACSSPVRFSIS